MNTIIFIVACVSLIGTMALCVAVIMMTEIIKSKLEEINSMITKQADLIIVISKFIRRNDLRHETERIIFDKIQHSIREFNNQFKMNVVDDDKPLEFPNDET